MENGDNDDFEDGAHCEMCDGSLPDTRKDSVVNVFETLLGRKLENIVDFGTSEDEEESDEEDEEESDEEDSTEPIQCSDCEVMVNHEDPYYSSPCGTFCSNCMRKHAKVCGICEDEFAGEF